MKFRPLLLLGLALWLCVLAKADFVHLGPVETLDNGVVVLSVAPRVGRVVAYHRPGEPDWLDAQDQPAIPQWHWNPWGGDRVWPTSQPLNPQIYGNKGFDPVIDGQPWEVLAKTSTRIELRSGVSPELGLRITRRIELVGNTTQVLHTFVLERVADSPFPVHVWAVTGVRKGDYMLMESDPRTPHEDGKPYRTWSGADFTVAPRAELLPDTRILHVLSPPEDTAMKAGTYGRWIAQIAGDSAFWQAIDYQHGQFYQDACNLQAFGSTKLKIHEIETLSPTWFLAKGETREWTVRWGLLDFPAETKSPSDRAALLSATAIPTK